MQHARTKRYAALAMALVALALIVFVRPADCEGGECAPGIFSLPLTLTSLMGIEEPAELPDELTVLIIGVDSRKGSSKVHCDAIHQVHINTVDDTIEFVNVPRGTYSYIPQPENWQPDQELLDAADAAIEAQEEARREEQEANGNEQIGTEGSSEANAEEALEVETEGEGKEPVIEQPVTRLGYAWGREQYISNVCEYIGVDEFVSRVDKITGHETDYRVMVGFSQAQGILRLLKLNPTATLQFLRHRQSYGLGDVQRSYNQSIFLEDLLVERFDQVTDMPLAAQAAAFQFVDTDMSYGVARGLLAWLEDSKARKDRERISHRTAPAYTPSAQEIHLDQENVEEQVAELLDRLRRYRPGFEVSDVQATLIAYTNQHLDQTYAALVDRDLVAARAALDPLIDQQIWHQIEDDQTRRDLIARLAIMDSTVEWYRTQSEGLATDLSSTLAVALSLEDAEETQARIEQHLSVLLGRKVQF